MLLPVGTATPEGMFGYNLGGQHQGDWRNGFKYVEGTEVVVEQTKEIDNDAIEEQKQMDPEDSNQGDDDEEETKRQKVELEKRLEEVEMERKMAADIEEEEKRTKEMAEKICKARQTIDKTVGTFMSMTGAFYKGLPGYVVDGDTIRKHFREANPSDDFNRKKWRKDAQ